MFRLISLKTKIARSVNGPKLQGPHAEDAMAKPYLELTTSVTWQQQVTRSQATIASLENNHRYAVVVQDLAIQWIQAYPCKNKTSQETQRNLQKFLPGTREETKSHLHWQFLGIWQSLWRSLLESLHVFSTPIGDSAVLLQWGLNESWCADSLLYCCNGV